MKRNEYPKKHANQKEEVMRILIADGNSLFRKLIKQVIIDHYNSVITSEAPNEHELFDEIFRYNFDAILLDLGFSEDKGLNLLNKILIVDSDIPVVIMSLFHDEQYEKNIYQAGYSGFISKLNLMNELIPVLEKISWRKRQFRSPRMLQQKKAGQKNL